MAETVVDWVRRGILEGRFPPGTWLRQEALAHELGTSRAPVREALRRLEAEGLVTLVPHRGGRVAALQLEEYIEIYKLREVLEPLAIAEATEHVTERELDEFEALADAIEAAADHVQRWLEADRRFHLATYACARLPRLLKLVSEFQNSTQQYRRAYLVVVGDDKQLDLLHAEHRLILRAMRRRDPVEASWRLQAHIRQTRNVLSQHPEIFLGPYPQQVEDEGSSSNRSQPMEGLDP